MGPEVAGVVVLAVTVVVSQGMTAGAALLALRLLHFPEAAAVAASRFGIKLSNVGQVSAVAVVGSTIRRLLPAAAVAMTAGETGTGGGTSKGALEIAEAGGQHAGFLRNYQGKPPDELRRGINSLEQIAEHKDKIANPEKHIPNWRSLDPRQQNLEGLLKKAQVSGPT